MAGSLQIASIGGELTNEEAGAALFRDPESLGPDRIAERSDSEAALYCFDTNSEGQHFLGVPLIDLCYPY